MRLTGPLALASLSLVALAPLVSSGGGGGPVITSITPSTLDSVVLPGTNVTISGSGFVDVTGVTVDGVALQAGFPPAFQVQSSTSILITNWPQVSALGPIDVVVQTQSGDSPAAQVTVVAPVTPQLHLTNEGAFLFTLTGAQLTVGAPPNEIVVVAVSNTDAGSVVHGVINLGIGDDFSLIHLVMRDHMPAQGWMTTNYDLTGLPTGLELFFQALNLGSGQLPVPVSPVKSATILF